ncbi:MAG: TonB-dependent receptor, partial [Gemmatimonas sp.]
RTLWAPRYKGALGVSGLLKQYASAGEEALTPAAHSSSGGLFLYQEIPLGRAVDDATAESRQPHLQIGARYDVYRIRSEDDGGKFGPGRSVTFTNASGSFGASAPLGQNMTLSGSVARAFRAPTVEELYSNGFHAAVGTYDVGNAALEAEVNTGVDGVLRAQSGRTSGQVSAYYNRISDYISPNIVRDTTLEESGVVPLNVFAQQDATLRGVEGQFEAEVVRHVVLGAVADMVRGRFTSGEALPFMPAARLGASLRWDTGRLFAGTDMRHGFAQERVSQPLCARADMVDIGSEGELPVEPGAAAPCVDIATPAYTVVNISGGFTWIVGAASHSVTLRADNVADTRYFDASSRIKSFTANPGRNLSVVYRLVY